MESTLAFVTHNVASLRAEPSGSSEQISQAIMGDRMEIQEEQRDFARVRASDAYEGWMLRKHLHCFSANSLFPGSPDDLSSLHALTPQHLHPTRPLVPDLPVAPASSRWIRVLAPLADVVTRPGDAPRLLTKLVLGTPVQALRGGSRSPETWAHVLLPNGVQGYVLQRALEQPRSSPFTHREICLLAQRFIGTPYLWGGTTPFGFDCSGFVQRMFSFAGITLPRDAYLQAQSPLGKPLSADKSVRAGDLVFFCGPSDPRGRGITHVGLALNRRQFIHASGRAGITITAFADPDFNQIYAYRGAWRAASAASLS